MTDAHQSELRCAVMITTHNRLGDLKRTCARLRELDPPPDEWLFTADGCEDGTDEWLRSEFPEATIIVNQPGKGSVPSRDRMIRMSTCDLILSLDDDSYPCEADAVLRLREFHASSPDVAVSTFPQRTEEYPETLALKRFPEFGRTGSFPNSGACFVTSVYRSLAGFPGFFFHAYEEPDYALQCIAGGYDVRHTNCITIRHHFTATGRNERRTHHRHARNECWSVMMRCPFPWMPFVLLGKAVSQARYAARRGLDWLLREPQWWLQALRGAPQAWKHRKPVGWATYVAWLRAMKNVSGGAA